MSTDTAISLETPEGTQIDIHPAGLYVRALAFVIDEALRWAIIVCGLSAAGFLGVFGQGLGLIVLFVTYWLYGVVFEVLNNGMTPGKKLRGLQVVHDDGTPIRLPASLLRNLVLWVDLLPVFYATGIVTMTLSARFQRLGDLAAGTLVIYRPELASEAVSGNHAADAQRARIPLRLEEQNVLVNFLERSDGLTSERSDELATIVAGALGLDAGDPAADPTDSVKQLASGFRGG